MSQQTFNGAENSSWRAFNIGGTVGGHPVSQIIFSATGPDLYANPASPPTFDASDLSSLLITLQIFPVQGGITTLRGGLSQLQFVEAVGTIPAPAALPLLLTALAGLGLLSASRRHPTTNERLSREITP